MVLADDAIELQRLTQSVTIENGVIAVLEYRMKFITLGIRIDAGKAQMRPICRNLGKWLSRN